jgi:glutamate racemase
MECYNVLEWRLCNLRMHPLKHLLLKRTILNYSLQPIGVFDSGVGGLTVLRELRARMPHENFIYLGDTARLPYGTKSRESIERYALQAAKLLTDEGIKCLVVACNTASAIAVETLRERFSPLPIVGVVEPGAEAGCRATRSGHIAVIATEGTVRGGAYEAAIAKRLQARVSARACPLFVALAEEGLTSGPIVESIARHYLSDLFMQGDDRKNDIPDTLVLGCTHFPVLTDTLRIVLGHKIAIVDSAVTVATALEQELEKSKLRREVAGEGTLRLLATDGPERFARVGSVFLGQPLLASEIHLVDLV